MKEAYSTIAAPASGHLREKGSRFLSLTFPVRDEQEIQQRLSSLQKEYFDATHHCFAWMLGAEGDRYRAFDDGEPGHSAGDPILGQIRSRGLTHVLVVVVRYYGGTNLGVGGLVKAYRGSASLALDAATVVTIQVKHRWKLEFPYGTMPDVMKFAKGPGIEILEKQIAEHCEMVVEVPASVDPVMKFAATALHGIVVTCTRLPDLQ